MMLSRRPWCRDSARIDIRGHLADARRGGGLVVDGLGKTRPPCPLARAICRHPADHRLLFAAVGRLDRQCGGAGKWVREHVAVTVASEPLTSMILSADVSTVQPQRPPSSRRPFPLSGDLNGAPVATLAREFPSPAEAWIGALHRKALCRRPDGLARQQPPRPRSPRHVQQPACRGRPRPQPPLRPVRHGGSEGVKRWRALQERRTSPIPQLASALLVGFIMHFSANR